MKTILTVILVMVSMCTIASNLDSIVSEDGNYKTIYKYDSNNREISSISYEFGQLSNEIITLYNSNGNRIYYSNIMYFSEVNSVGTEINYYYSNEVLVGENSSSIIDGIPYKSDSIVYIYSNTLDTKVTYFYATQENIWIETGKFNYYYSENNTIAGELKSKLAELQVYTDSNNKIHIEGSYSQVYIYNLKGQEVYELTSKSLPLIHGIYIVVVKSGENFYKYKILI